MSYFWKVLLIIIVFIKQEADLALTLRKFVHQKDMSEHCRRRVVPSVFLGKQVVDAYSQILQFSQLELPYSCFIGVRTESGSNIILVIQLVSNKTLIDSCRVNKNQLLVYELGETFGGYWGALPHGVMDAKPKEDEQQYAIKTTQPTTTTEKKTTTHTPPPTMSTTEEVKPVKPPKDYIVEIPIVNVSFQLVPGRLPPKAIFDTEDSFDKIFDVKPWPNMTYKSTVLPLLQFSLEDEDVGGALRTPVAVEPELPEFQVDFNSDIFTPDYRLPYPVFNLPTKRPQHKYNVNHRLNFKKNKMLLAEKQSLFLKTSLPMFPYHTFVSRPHDVFTSHYRTSQSPLNKEHSESWDAVNAILKNLNRSGHVDGKTKVDDNVEKLLQGLAKIGSNETGLALNASSDSSVEPSVTASWHSTTEYKTDSITWRQPSATYRTNYLDDEIEEPVTQVSSSTASNIVDSIGILLPVLGIDTVILNITQPEKNESSTLNESESTTLATTSIEKPLTLLDHESWENMVHAASLMAVALNQSVTAREDVDTQGDNVTISTLSSTKMRHQRKKRYIHAIPIEHVKPHHLPVMQEIPTSTPYSDRIFNAQEFQRRIELQDDEIHDRVALRYLSQYVGPVLFNICDFDEAAARHVYLFNSSRLVLAISNFTLERMTVVVTPARTLLSSDAQCPSANLECQVSGARVCIDSLSACDGVPNCGSYDIYDEDRLTCGRSAGVQHNVCLAAITFLAVLLTLLYIVHYWLKRCVPRVSDAFFIYTDAAENVLYLDPIMRSPYDTEDPKVFYRTGVIPDDMECTDMKIKSKSVSPYIRRFLSLFRWRCNSNRNAAPVTKEQEIDIDFDRHRMYSYGEVELTKLGGSALTDMAVQTGSSLLGIPTLGSVVVNVSDHGRSSVVDSEMEDIVTYYEGKRRSKDSNIIDLDDRESTERVFKELSILEFFKRARSVSVDMPPYQEERSSEYLTQLSPQREEEEIQSLNYEPSFQVPASVTSMNMEISGKKIEHANVQKKLRFEDIKAESPSENVNVEGVMPERGRRSVVYGAGKNMPIEQSDSGGQIDEPSTSTNRKTYFWGSSKSKPKKPTKKKTQLFSSR